MKEDIRNIIKKTIDRKKNVDYEENVSLYSQGINSLEMVQLVIAIENQYNISFDNLLNKLNIVSINDICEEVYNQINS